MAYKDVLKGLKTSASAENGSRRYSKTDYVNLTHAALNEEDVKATYYSNPSADKPVVTEKQPVKEYREALKDVVAPFGVDKHELDKVHEIPLSKRHAEALVSVAQMVQHDYIATGKQLRLPQMAADETTVTLSQGKAPEKTEATKKNVEVDGKYQQVPTGKTVRTKERTVTKSSNKVPAWLKSEV